MNFLDLVPVALAAILGAVALSAVVILVIDRFLGLRSGLAAGQGHNAGETALLFQDGLLTDATPGGRRLLTTVGQRGSDLGGLVGFLSHRFPELPARLAELGGDGQAELTDSRSGEVLQLNAWDGIVRVALAAGGTGTAGGSIQDDSLADELGALRALVEDLPHLVWQTDAQGALVWANRAYLDLSDHTLGLPPGHGAAWPKDPLFPPVPASADGQPVTARQQVRLPGRDRPQWFEITSLTRDTGQVHFATDANTVVAAEEARSAFVQTLAKTFAQLATGLAIFDRDRRLVMFNPAFLDLTGLPIDFLSRRPMVQSVLDRLRDRNMLPEPKNYLTWRDQVAALEAAAERGTYCESWTLPGGQTYRVTGRPHPDGAIAFLFEDISDEIQLTRRFRSELETTGAVLDLLDEGIAVFSPAGTMTLSNAPYDALWPGDVAIDRTLRNETARWRELVQPGVALAELVAALDQGDGRRAWSGTLRLTDGRAVLARIAVLAGGARVVRFRTVAADGTGPVATKDMRASSPAKPAEPATAGTDYRRASGA